MVIQSVPPQYGNADDLYPEGFTGQRQGIELVARPGRVDLHALADVCAQRDARADLASGSRHMVTAASHGGEIAARALVAA